MPLVVVVILLAIAALIAAWGFVAPNLLAIIVAFASFPVGEFVTSFDDLIELTTVEPYATALRTVIYFDALAVGNDQDDITLWTFHGGKC